MTSTSHHERTHRTTHSITVAAPASRIYRLIADAERWPYVFDPTVHVERQPLGESEERLRLWATANGQVRSWESHRTLDADRLRVEFRQVVSTAPVEAMSGTWILEPQSDTVTEVVLLHDFRAVGDDPEAIALIEQATDRNSTAELAALRRTAELGDEFDELVLTFADTVDVEAPAAAVYRYLDRADEWPALLPHVARLRLAEPAPGVQSMEMDTIAVDGSVHTTHSYRVCFPDRDIVYKQTSRPVVMAAHTGRWSIRETATGVSVTSEHTVVIRPEHVAGLPGGDGTVAGARALIRRALSTNSLTTLKCVKSAAEDAVQA